MPCSATRRSPVSASVMSGASDQAENEGLVRIKRRARRLTLLARLRLAGLAIADSFIANLKAVGTLDLPKRRSQNV